jgi:hypothetical protein
VESVLFFRIKESNFMEVNSSVCRLFHADFFFGLVFDAEIRVICSFEISTDEFIQVFTNFHKF